MRTDRKLASFFVVALVGASLSSPTLAQMVRNKKKPPNRGSATNRVDLVLDMKDGKCSFTATPAKVWANKSVRDKVKWDVTNHCDTSGIVKISFANSPFEAGCTLATKKLNTGQHDDVDCRLAAQLGATTTYPYTVILGADTLPEDPDVEVWD